MGTATLSAPTTEQQRIDCATCGETLPVEGQDGYDEIGYCEVCSKRVCSTDELSLHGITRECGECAKYARYVDCHSCGKEISLKFHDIYYGQGEHEDDAHCSKDCLDSCDSCPIDQEYTEEDEEAYESDKDDFERNRNSYYGYCMSGRNGRKEFQKMYGDGSYMSLKQWLVLNKNA